MTTKHDNQQDSSATSGEVPSGRDYAAQRKLAVTGQWIAGWEACRNYRATLPAPQAATTEQAKSCTCPSGDGSLRWPCPQHPPEATTASASGESFDTPLMGTHLEHIRHCAASDLPTAKSTFLDFLAGELGRAPAPSREADESTLEALMHKHGLIGVAGDNPKLEASLIAFANDAAALAGREAAGQLDDLWIHEDMDRDATEAILNLPRKELKKYFVQAREDVATWRRRALTAEAALAQHSAPQPANERLLTIIAHAYQFAGAHNAPEHVLDVLADPEAATDEQIEAMLSYEQPAATDAEVGDEELPPLPKAHEFVVRGIPRYMFTAEQYRQGQREAIAMGRGTAVRDYVNLNDAALAQPAAPTGEQK